MDSLTPGLARNAVATDAPASRVLLLRRRSPRALRLPDISPDVQVEHAYVFAEREGLKLDSGMVPDCGSKLINPDCCAHHSTLLEVGCAEFFDCVSALPYVYGLARCSAPRPAPIYCARCESIGHAVEACPFKVGDVDVLNAARYRRERRSRREAAA